MSWRDLYPSMLAVARGYVRSRAVAEEVVQESWLGVLKGLDRFEGRSSLRTWVLKIVANVARTRAVREARSVPLSLRDRGRRAERGPRSVSRAGPALPRPLALAPDRLAPAAGGAAHVAGDAGRRGEAIEELPEAQRLVITMRDVAGVDSDDVCDALGITAGNQRVLLHRARARVREALERHFDA